LPIANSNLTAPAAEAGVAGKQARLGRLMLQRCWAAKKARNSGATIFPGPKDAFTLRRSGAL
jgi:hypothetical protein